MNKCVYITGPLLASLCDELKDCSQVLYSSQGLEDEKLALCNILLPGKERITDEIMAKAASLELICKQGVGLDRIDIDAATKRGILVANTPHVNVRSVAEHTFALIMASARRLYPISLDFRCEKPDFKCGNRYMEQTGEMFGKTLSVIGYGNIGREVAKIGAAFGMRVLVYSRSSVTKLPEGAEKAASLEQALKEGDFVTLHVSGNEENRNMIGAEELDMMKKSATLINTTRGFVVDEDALYKALICGTIASAALDVFETEPVTEMIPLLTLKNVVATPHTGGNTPEARERTLAACARIVRDFCAGSIPDTVVNARK